MGEERRIVYVASATRAPGDTTAGVYVFEQDDVTGELRATGAFAASEAATFIALSPEKEHLYAVRAMSDGGVAAFAAPASGELMALNRVATGAQRPCHVTVDPSGHFVVTAHYGSGHVSVHRRLADGRVGERCDLVLPQGGGPNLERQEHAHAHYAWAEPTGRFILLVDLGTDSLWTYRLDHSSGRLAEVAVGRSDPGAGPRHLRAHRDGSLLVTGELGSSLMVFDYDAETGVTQWRSSVPATALAGAGANAPSELVLDASGAYCYVANRGPDCISVFSLASGTPKLVEDVPCLGTTPRHLAMIGNYLYVANQDSGSVVVFAVDAATGSLRATGHVVELPRPMCILARA